VDKPNNWSINWLTKAPFGVYFFKNMEKIKLKMYQVQSMCGWLNAPMHGEKARIRNKFITSVREHMADTEAKRIAVLEDLADKDEKSEPIMENKSFKLTSENLAKFGNKYTEILNEEVEVEVEKTGVILEMLKELTTEFDIVEGARYDEVCSIFERVQEEKK